MKKSMLSVLLVFVMLIGMVPTCVFANSRLPSDEYGSFIDGDQLINDIIETSGMNAHPRIIMSEEKFAALRAQEGKDTVIGILLEELRGSALLQVYGQALVQHRGLVAGEEVGDRVLHLADRPPRLVDLKPAPQHGGDGLNQQPRDDPPAFPPEHLDQAQEDPDRVNRQDQAQDQAQYQAQDQAQYQAQYQVQYQAQDQARDQILTGGDK